MRQRNDLLQFLIVLLRGGGPSAWLVAAFALGLLVVAILGNLVFSLLLAPGDTSRAAWRPFVVAVGLLVVAYILYSVDRRRSVSIVSDVDESRLAPPHLGLIWLFGPGRFDHLLFALRHHIAGGGGAHCWLIMENSAPVLAAANELCQQMIDEGLPTQLHRVYIDRLEVEPACEAVRTVLERRAAEALLARDQVIADITGATKPLTAGMVLAALTTLSPSGAVELEYIESDRDEHGRPVPGTQRAVLVDISFSIERGA